MDEAGVRGRAERLRGKPRGEIVVDRDALDGWLRAAAPPGVPFEAVVLPGSELRARFPDGPTERRSHHLLGKLRMPHRAPVFKDCLEVHCSSLRDGDIVFFPGCWHHYSHHIEGSISVTTQSCPLE